MNIENEKMMAMASRLRNEFNHGVCIEYNHEVSHWAHANAPELTTGYRIHVINIGSVNGHPTLEAAEVALRDLLKPESRLAEAEVLESKARKIREAVAKEIK